MARSFAVKVCSVPLVSERSTVWIRLPPVVPAKGPAQTVKPQGEAPAPVAQMSTPAGQATPAPIEVARVSVGFPVPPQLAVFKTHAGIWFHARPLGEITRPLSGAVVRVVVSMASAVVPE